MIVLTGDPVRPVAALDMNVTCIRCKVNDDKTADRLQMHTVKNIQQSIFSYCVIQRGLYHCTNCGVIWPLHFEVMIATLYVGYIHFCYIRLFIILSCKFVLV